MEKLFYANIELQFLKAQRIEDMHENVILLLEFQFLKVKRIGIFKRKEKNLQVQDDPSSHP